MNRKTPAVALIERNGDMHRCVVSNMTQKNLKAVVDETVSTDAIINTDECGVY
jgi:transposase-like protein